MTLFAELNPFDTENLFDNRSRRDYGYLIEDGEASTFARKYSAESLETREALGPELLGKAVRLYRPIIARFLVQNGVDPNFDKGRILLEAIKDQKEEIVAILLEGGADVRLVPSALSIAVSSGREDIVRILLKHRTKVHSANRKSLSSGQIENADAVLELLCGGLELHRYPPKTVKQFTKKHRKDHILSGIGTLIFHLQKINGACRSSVALAGDWADRLGVKNTDGTVPPRFQRMFVGKCPKEFHFFRSADRAAKISASMCCSGDYDAFCKLLKNDMHAFLKSDISAREFLSPPALGPYYTIQDMVSEFRDVVLLPMTLSMLSSRELTAASRLDDNKVRCLRMDLREPAASMLIGEHTSSELIRFNNLWHRPDKALPDDAQPVFLKENPQWQPAFQGIVNLSNGWRVVCRASRMELIHEGRLLHHCVGGRGYVDLCLTGSSNMLSLEKDEKVIATIEIIEDQNGEIRTPQRRNYHAKQKFQYGNKTLESDPFAAWTEFCERSEKGEVNWNLWLGETVESKKMRQSISRTSLEQITGIELGEPPDRALEHYLELKLINRDSGETFLLAPHRPLDLSEALAILRASLKDG